VGPQTHDHNSVKYERIFKKIVTEKFPGKFVVKYYMCLANTLLKGEKSARDNHVLACNFAKYSPILPIFRSQTQQ